MILNMLGNKESACVTAFILAVVVLCVTDG